MSELARIELVLGAAGRGKRGRLADPILVERRFLKDCQEDGPPAVVALRLQLAVALVDARRLASVVRFVTRDTRQASAASAEGLIVEAGPVST